MPTKTKTLLIIIILITVTISSYFYYDYENKKQEIVFLDVGQGDSSLINLAGNNEILIDGGPGESVLYELGKYLPFYERSIELMVLSHAHDDHLFGLIEVLKRYRVKEILMRCDLENKATAYQEFLELLKQKSVPIICAEDNKLIDLKSAKLEIIYPAKNCDLCLAEPGGNNSSLVFRVEMNNKKILFTGDIELKAESEILKNVDMEKLPADILKIPHHGSDTSLSEEFLNTVAPSKAIIFVGAGNSFGHPSLRTIKRLEREGIKIFRTDQMGSIMYNE